MSGSCGRGRCNVVVLVDVEQGKDCRTWKRVKEEKIFLHEFSGECNIDSQCSFPEQEVCYCFHVLGAIQKESLKWMPSYSTGHLSNIP